MLVIYIAIKSEIGGLAFELPDTAGIIDISYTMHFLDHENSSSISQLIINGKSSDLQKLLKYFNGTTTSATNIVLSSSVLPIYLVLYSKYVLAIVLLLFTLFLVRLFSLTSKFISSL